ncbi:MAG: sterol desaturase family protein [Candidatus Kapaibacteriota bacterium]|jgi:sterol desaturase/sphingolipid hydroxylase (fatty acid hydroxylase superfamily)
MLPLPHSVALGIIGVLSLCVALEMLWSWRKHKRAYNTKETFANIAILLGFQISKVALFGYQLYWSNMAFSLALLPLPEAPWVFACCFVATDCVYYWHHRIMHTTRFFWMFHVVHHSSPWMNLTTSYRLNWLSGIFGVFFYLPLIIIGFPPKFVAASVGLGLLYQFFLHTEAIGKLGVVEGILNTPSAHRVHHATNKQYIDKNYGGVFMLWDRVFGTYIEEEEKPQYGITSGFQGHNPFQLVFHGFADYVRGKMHYKG